MEQYSPWLVFIGYILALLAFDFFVLHRKNTVISSKQALLESGFFLLNAMIFAGMIYWYYDTGRMNNPEQLSATQAVLKYLSGYAVELSLSVDNLFVIALIFSNYKVPSEFQHKLLFLGILGALVFRALLISFGLVLIHKIHGMSIVFGLFLLFTALKMLKKPAQNETPDKPRGLLKFLKFSNSFDGDRFVTRIDGKRVFTALFVALLTIELTDLLFALDSIPAIISITTDPYLVFSSNIFAIMGLRSLYFLLANMLDRFAYLKYSVFVILLFVSFKLIVTGYIELPEWFSLAFIALSLITGIAVSMMLVKADEK